MQSYLEQIGFEPVEAVLDGELGYMTKALERFSARIKHAAVVVFLCSGHGFQLNQKNYFLPKNGSIDPAHPELALSLEQNILTALAAADDAVKLVFWDACRKGADLPAGVPEGPAKPAAIPRQTLFAFASIYGQAAQSGPPAGFSPFSSVVLESIRQPGLEIRDLLKHVHDQVLINSHGSQEPREEGLSGLPAELFLSDPVFVTVEVPEDVKNLFVILNGEVVLDSSQQSAKSLRLNADKKNPLVLLVSNGRTYRNGHDWDVTEGWSYKVKFSVPNQEEWTFEDNEDHPFKNGPHHGGVFTVVRGTFVVDPANAKVTLEGLNDKVWKSEGPFSARDQDLLYEVRVTDLPLDKILDPQKLPDFGIIPGATVSVLLRELLTTGKFLDQKIADPENTFVTVRGNKAFRDLVQICMKDQEDKRIEDLFASIKAVLNRARNPFDPFINGLNSSLQQLATASITLPPEARADARVWTAIEDRSTPPQPATAPGAGTATGTGPVGSVAPEALRAAVVSTGTRSSLPAAVRAEAVVTQNPLFQKQPDELFSVPIPFDRVVQGVPLTAQAFAFMAIRFIDGKVRVNVRTVADLSDLQTKIGALVDLVPLPTNQCAEFGAVNNVARIWGKKITIDGDVASLQMSGDVDGWFCSKGVPCSRLVWHGLIPEVEFFDCNPAITTHVFNQPFDATIPFSLGVADQLTLELRLGQPSVNLGGQLAGITNGILRIAGVDLNDKLREALSSVINPDLLKGALPENLLQLDPVVTKAGLFSNSGALAASVELNVPFDLRILKALMEALAKLNG